MSQTPRDTSWFLAQCKPNSHRVAERHLHRQGFASFLPVQVVTRRLRGRFAERMVPLFPGYIFVAFDPDAGAWRAINATQGITRLVAQGGTPQPVPAGLMEQLRQRCDATGCLLGDTALAPGDTATLTRGPFSDFVASIETVAPDRRVWVLLDFMGQTTRLSVAPDDLQLARRRDPALLGS